MKRLAEHSQYFLRNPGFVAQLVRKTSISREDTVYDIGAGSGVIASALAARAGKVIAVEYEPITGTKLSDNMARLQNVEVVVGDFLTMELPATDYKVFSNIPFHLSSQIVRRLTEADNPPSAIYLIVQKQFAKKLIQSDSHFTGALGMMVGPLYEVKILRELRRTDYWPHPNVDTVLLAMTHRAEPLLPSNAMPTYRMLIEQSFHDPKVFTKLPRAAVGISPERKPSELTLVQWIELYRLVSASRTSQLHYNKVRAKNQA